MIRIVEDLAVEPAVWVLVFNRATADPWARRLARGPFKHVSAYAFLPDLRQWLFVDVHSHRTEILVATDQSRALAIIAMRTKDAALVSFAPRRDPVRIPWSCRLGFWCVPAIKHLIGLPSRALTPTGLYRAVIAAGGCVAHEDPAPEGQNNGPEVRTAAA